MIPHPVRRYASTCSIIALVVFTGAKISAPTATISEVLAAYAKACGDTERLKTHTTLVEQSVIESAENTETLRIVRAKVPDKIRIETLSATGRLVQGFDGFTAWCVLKPRNGRPLAVPLDPDTERELRLAARTALRNPLLEADTFGLTLTLSSDDASQHLVAVSNGARELYRLRIDRDSGRPLARIESRQGQQITTRYDSFRMIDGVNWPATATTSFAGNNTATWRLAQLRLDEKLDDELFAPPAGAASPTPAL
jgi:hypothetical protein